MGDVSTVAGAQRGAQIRDFASWNQFLTREPWLELVQWSQNVRNESGMFPLTKLAKGLKCRKERMAMLTEIRNTDSKAQISLPKAFANATVIVEQISETEIRIRKADAVPEDEVRFWEESRAPLSDRDRDLFLEMLDNPPPPNEYLRKAAAEYKKRHG